MRKIIESILAEGREECITDIDITMLDAFEEIGRSLSNLNVEPNEVYTYSKPVSGLSASTLKSIVEHYSNETLFDYIHGSEHTRLVLEFMNFNRMNTEDFRKKFPNAFRKWSGEDDEKLLDGRRSGKSLKELSVEFNRNVNAIKVRLERLGAGDDETRNAVVRFRNR